MVLDLCFTSLVMWLLASLVFLQVLLIAFIVLVSFRVKKRAEEIENIVYDLVTPNGAEPSKLILMIDKVAAVFSARIVTSAEAAIRGSAGGSARAVAAGERAEQLAANPIMGLLAGSKLGKSPIALAGLQQLIGMFGHKSGNGNGGGHSGQPPKFSLGV